MTYRYSLFVIAGFVFFFFAGIFCVCSQGLEEIKNFGNNPGNLRMFTYFPSDIANSEKVPIVVVLHGCSQNAKQVSKISGWNHLSDKYHFAVLYPQQKKINNINNCFNWFLSGDINRYGGETESIKNMIDYVVDNFNIDKSKVFIYGLSAGAAMSVSLLANFPVLFKSGLVFAGAPYGVAKNYKESVSAILKVKRKTAEEWGQKVLDISGAKDFPSLVICHGTKDKIVNIGNSYEIIKQWTFLHNIDTVPDNIVYGFDDNPLITRYAYCDPAGVEKVVFYRFDNLGHRLPVDPGNLEKQGGKKNYLSKDIDFFLTYFVAKEFGLIKYSDYKK